MTQAIDHSTLHRTAKYFMDNGQASTHEEAVALLNRFGLSVSVGDEVATSAMHQTALLTLINVARRTFLAGIEVVGVPDCPILVPLAAGPSIADAIRELGGTVVNNARAGWPCAMVGTAAPTAGSSPKWQLTWEGWRGGVIPFARGARLDEANAIPLAPVLAAAICAAEVFAFHAGDHPMAGKRSLGLSLWCLDADWLVKAEEPPLAYLPSRLWIIGLGNLGQAFAWLIALLPYQDRREAHIVLQDFDRIAESNDSTSLLSFLRDIGRRKARVVAEWLDRAAFETFLEERRFGSWTRRTEQEPGVALCGVDNALARASLENAGFDLIVEVGLGGGPQAFRSISLHTFPATRAARDIWSPQVGQEGENYEDMPAYQALKEAGMDKCGLTQLASRTVGVPFVGLIAACIGIAELLRRLNGGIALEFAAGSVSSLEFEFGSIEASAYSHGHLSAIKGGE